MSHNYMRNVMCIICFCYDVHTVCICIGLCHALDGKIAAKTSDMQPVMYNRSCVSVRLPVFLQDSSRQA